MKLRWVLNEIGDSTKIFNYNKSSIPDLKNEQDDDIEIVIKFKTDKNTEYNCELQFSNMQDLYSKPAWELTISFYVTDSGYSHETNKFEIFSVMATISDIVVSCLKMNAGLLYRMFFDPTKTSEEDTKNIKLSESQRGKLYLKYIENKFSQTNIKYNIKESNLSIQINILSVDGKPTILSKK